MKRRLATVSFVVAMLIIVAARTANAENIDLQALTQETQKMSQKNGDMTMAWWIPEEFWAASLAQNPQMTTSQIEEFLKVIRPYTIVVVVDGTMGAFGGITYKSEDFIRANTRLLDSQGKSYVPKNEAEVDVNTKNMLQMLKPVFVNMLGAMGQNMHFLLFSGKADNGKQIANAKDKGQFRIKLGEKEFKWRLPLDAILAAQNCSNCKQECKGSWSFCPWCGKKLSKETGRETIILPVKRALISGSEEGARS